MKNWNEVKDWISFDDWRGGLKGLRETWDVSGKNWRREKCLKNVKQQVYRMQLVVFLTFNDFPKLVTTNFFIDKFSIFALKNQG